MNKAEKFQLKLDKLFGSGAWFTYDLNPGSVTMVASRVWALREYENTILVAIIFAGTPRRWIHRIVAIDSDSKSALWMKTADGRKVVLRPLNPNSVKPEIYAKVLNEDRTIEDIDQELDAFLEANPHTSLAGF